MAETHPVAIIAMFLAFLVLVWTGFPIAWVLGGVAMLFTAIGTWWVPESGLNLMSFTTMARRCYDLLDNAVLVAIPMFVFMGLMLDRSGLAERMMNSMQGLFGRLRGGLAIAVTCIGILLAASTGIVGASVVLLGLLGLPLMLRQGYDARLASGTVAAAGTLGILMPPSIMLVIMSDQANVSVGDLFIGAIVPALLLGIGYIGYIVVVGLLRPSAAPLASEPLAADVSLGRQLLRALRDIAPALGLIVAVLGSILLGWCTTTEASGIGAAGAAVLALIGGKERFAGLRQVLADTLKTCGYIFGIFIGATCFAFVLRRFGGDEFITAGIDAIGAATGPGGVVLVILGIVFLLGFFLDWIEISLIVLPLVAVRIGSLPMDIDSSVDAGPLVWFVLLVAICLQTSFLTPPVGFSLFYLKGVAPPEVGLGTIYRGVIPFVVIQVIVLLLVFLIPDLVLWLPERLLGDGG